MKKANPARWNPNCPNFIVPGTYFQDIWEFITPALNEVIQVHSTMEDVVVWLGKFSSKGEARKNGWAGPIPSGFNMWQIGKDQFCTLNMIGIPR